MRTGGEEEVGAEELRRSVGERLPEYVPDWSRSPFRGR